MRFLIITILSIWSNCVWSQDTFYSVFTNNGTDIGYGITQMPDSNYVLTGQSTSFQNTPSNVLLTKLDKQGNKIWSTSFGGDEVDIGVRVVYNKQGHFYISGFTNSGVGNDFDALLMKVDTLGQLVWEKHYGGSGWERVHDMVFDSDSNILIVGESSSNVFNNQDIFVLKLNQEGDTIWNNVYASTGVDNAYGAIQYDDTSYVIAGEMYDPTVIGSKAWVARISTSGMTIWENLYGNTKGYKANALVKIEDDILLTGVHESDQTNGKDFFMIRLDSAGVEVAFKEEALDGDAEGVGVTTFNFFANPNHIFVAKRLLDQFSFPGGTDLNMDWYIPSNLNWHASCFLSHEKPEIVGEVITTLDGGVAVVGALTQLNNGSNDVFVAKLGMNGVCPDLATGTVDEVVSLDEMGIKAEISVIPNPFESHFHIDGLEPGDLIKIFDLNGRLLMVTEEAEVSTSDWNSGSYILKVFRSSQLIAVKHLLK